MGRQTRIELLEKIENERSSKVITYITGDRRGLETKISQDVAPYFYDLLNVVGKVPHIDLFIYSPGGQINAGFGLVNLLREFCEKLRVLIPYKAQSTATLISLGANEIVMGPMAVLSPIDPSVTSAFNPQLNGQFLPLSVEDVAGYFDLAKQEAGLSGEESLRVIFEKLATAISPMALGNVYRAREQIGMLARRLLDLHMDEHQKGLKETIIGILTKERYSHDYLISRREAKEEIGLKVKDDLSDDLEKNMMALYQDYAKEAELQTPYKQESILGQESEKLVEFSRAFIETTDGVYTFKTKRNIKRIVLNQPQGPVNGYEDRDLEEGWVKET